MKRFAWRGLRTAAAASAATCFAAGCTLSVVPPDAGSGGSSSGGGGTQTVGDQCTSIYTEFCSQAIGRCAVAVDLDSCIKNYVDTCCVGSVCSETSKSPASAVDACKSAIDAEDCNLIVNASTPNECQGIPQEP